MIEIKTMESIDTKAKEVLITFAVLLLLFRYLL